MMNISQNSWNLLSPAKSEKMSKVAPLVSESGCIDIDFRASSKKGKLGYIRLADDGKRTFAAIPIEV